MTTCASNDYTVSSAASLTAVWLCAAALHSLDYQTAMEYVRSLEADVNQMAILAHTVANMVRAQHARIQLSLPLGSATVPYYRTIRMPASHRKFISLVVAFRRSSPPCVPGTWWTAWGCWCL